jgi:hypothetical protein
MQIDEATELAMKENMLFCKPVKKEEKKQKNFSKLLI